MIQNIEIAILFSIVGLRNGRPDFSFLFIRLSVRIVNAVMPIVIPSVIIHKIIDIAMKSPGIDLKYI